MKSLKIGDVRVKNQLFLSPMVDVTDLAYRMLCRKQGAGMAYTEMLYVDAILHENAKTKMLMKTSSRDRPVGIQVTGNSASEFSKLARMKELWNYNLVDLNCGCPSIRITGHQAGSYLLQNPEKIVEMINILKDQGLVVTAKIRLGFKENNVLKISKMLEQAGADALTLHARLAWHSNKIPADWKWIAKVKENIGIPIIGNGDVASGASAEKMLEMADGCMVARAAIGNPFVFREITRYLRTGKEKEVTKQERLKALADYIKLAEKYKVLEFGRVKYLAPSFLSGFQGASKAREEVMKMKTTEGIRDFIGGL